MSDSGGKILWRVHAADGQPRAAAFDALLLAADRPAQEELRPSRLIGVDVPFERELPNVPLTLIVRANIAGASLICECDVLGADGKRRVYGRSASSLAVFLCSKAGIVVTGLPAPASESTAPAT
jgi:hypothetical protein